MDLAGEAVGSGFLIGPDLVATCAHVVADAADGDPSASAPPQVALTLDFPVLTGGAAQRRATVHRWVPIGDDGTGDVALLRLDAAAPQGAVMSPVRRVEGLWDHHFRVFGFPDGRWDGVWATGRIRGGQGTGWFQLQGDPGGQPIAGGFSGAPVWDDETGAVVGMTVAADRDPGVTTAYLIPIEQVLGLDPELLPSPYRGLEPFDEEHAEFFFGREPDLVRLLAALQECPLVVIDGPSGVGKSSLVRAGLLPGLRAEGSRFAPIQPRPGLPAVLDAVTALLTLADPGSSAVHHARDGARISAAIADPATRGAALDELVAGLTGADAMRMVLFVDQFEELAEAAPDAAAQLLGLLADVALRTGRASGLRILLTVRGVALAAALAPAVVDALGSGTVLVGPMDRTRLREAIVRPAERAPGLAFEDGLVDRILDDAGAEPGQLALVESLLAQLWARREGGTLTNAGYAAAGGVAGALAAHAELVAARFLGDQRSHTFLWALCTRLAVPGRDGRFVRKPLRYAELPVELRGLVPPLVTGRLLVVAGSAGSGGTVELAHQALIDHWPRLRDWLAADRAFIAWHAQLDYDRQRWESGGREPGGLLRGSALSTAQQWAQARHPDLTAAEIDYVNGSRIRRQRDVRRARIIGAVVAVLAILAGGLTVVAVRGGSTIAVQQAAANAEILADKAAATARTDPLLGVELAQAAWKSDPASSKARSALAGLHLALDSTEAVLTGRAGGEAIRSVSAVGTDVAGVTEVVTATGVTLISGALDPASPARVLPGVRSGVLSPDGRSYVGLAADGAVQLWNTSGEAPATTLTGPAADPPQLAGFTPDAARVGWLRRAATGPATLTTYDVGTGKATDTPLALPAPPTEVHLTAAPDLVVVRSGATGSPDDRLAAHAVSTGAEVRAFPSGARAGAAGTTVTACTAGDPGKLVSPKLTVIDPTTGAVLRDLRLMFGTPCDLTWPSADGRFLIEAAPAARDAQNSAFRATDVATGVSYQFSTPPINIGDWAKGKRTPRIAVLPDPDGVARVVMAAGPTALRLHTTPEVPVAPEGVPPSRVLDTGGGVLVAVDRLGLRTFDMSNGRELARRARPMSNDFSQNWSDQPWVLDRDATAWTLTAYSLPDLTPGVQITLPAGPGPLPDEKGARVAFSGPVDGKPQSVLGIVGGALSAWDATTGRPLGTPIQLASDVTEGQWYRSNVQLWPRLGHPEQALVGTPTGSVQLWDVPAGKLLRELPIPVIGPSSIAAAGDQLAVRTKWEAIDVWDLATGEQVAENLPFPGIVSLRGFTAAGDLVAVKDRSFDDERIVVYSLRERRELAALRPASAGYALVDAATVRLSGEYGFMPMTIPVDVGYWRQRLCRLTPAAPSAAALAAFPPGTDSSPGCS